MRVFDCFHLSPGNIGKHLACCFGALLIFDEVVTAFRLGLSGAQGYFGGASRKAGLMGDRLTAGLLKLIEKYKLPFVAFNQGSIVHLETVGTMHFAIDWLKPWRIPKILKETSRRKVEMEHMGAAYMAEGLVTLAGSRLYTSAAYSEAMIDDALAGFERVFANVAVR